jgi:hypothetical protein
MPKTWLPVAAALLLTLGGAGCTARPAGYSDFDPQTDFSGFRSFAWTPGRVLVVATPNPVNPALEPTLKETTQAYLTGRGYRFVADPGEADFVVGFSVGGTPTVNTASFTDNYRQVRIIGQSRDAEVVTQESTEAGLVIDIYDRVSGQKKWMGWSVTEVTRSDQVNLRPAVRELIGIILEHFPPEVPAQGG